MSTIEATSISAHKTYSCTRPKTIERRDYCQRCTSRHPNMRCKFLKIETVYIKD